MTNAHLEVSIFVVRFLPPTQTPECVTRVPASCMRGRGVWGVCVGGRVLCYE